METFNRDLKEMRRSGEDIWLLSGCKWMLYEAETRELETTINCEERKR